MMIRSKGAAYWACQAGGWTAYSAIGLLLAVQHLGWRPSLVVGYAVYALYSIALTDLLHRRGRRDGWLGGPITRAWPHLLGAILTIGAIQTTLIVVLNRVMDGVRSPFQEPGQVGYVAMGTTVATTMWVIYYRLFTARRRRLEQEARLQVALREAELRALEAQIRPHFLFNSLNSIRGLVVEDPARAQDMITRLADLLRHNLRHDLRHTVPLSSEVAAVRDYLALESVRFEDRLRVRIDVAADALPIQVPSMLLQTLVENAVKHGIATRPDGGDLLIRARVDGDRMVLDVENSGGLGEAASDAGQVGLANTRDRLHLLYGGRADLHLIARPPETVAARVLIPLTA